jgi:transposase
MIQIAPSVHIYLACRPVDMRRGFDGLSADVAQALKGDPYSGAVFVFRGKRGDYLKILTLAGSGLCLFAKRLEKGKFVWPPIEQPFAANRFLQRARQVVPGVSCKEPSTHAAPNHPSFV